MGYAADVARFHERLVARQHAMAREVVGRAALSLITKSPVGDPALWKNKAPKGYEGGRFVANWRLGVGGIDRTTTHEIDADGGPTLDRIVGSIPAEAGGKVYFISNSLAYAIPLENGHSTQAPVGMVTLTAIEFPTFVREANAGIITINGRSFGG